MSYKNVLDPDKTPVTRPIAGREAEMVKNNAGGFVFETDDHQQLMRFLILGALDGTYYAEKNDHANENIGRIRKIVDALGVEAIKIATKVSVEGLAQKNVHAITVLALGVVHPDVEVKKSAYRNVTLVCRTFNDLAEFINTAGVLKSSPISGDGFKKAVARWYNEKDTDKLGYQLVKYRMRNKWTHADVLRKAHPVIADPVHNALYRYSLGKEIDKEYVIERTEKNNPEFHRTDVYPGIVGVEMPDIIKGFEAAKLYTNAESQSDRKNLVKVIEQYKLTHEMVDNSMLQHASVWKALLPHMPLRALVWNLGKISSVGLLKGGKLNDTFHLVAEKLTDEKTLQRSRLHPITLLVAMRAYKEGASSYGRVSWTVVPELVDVLEKAFYKSFKFVEPTNKRIMLALDVSGSMWWSKNKATGLLPAEISACMAMVTARVEPYHAIYAFSTHFEDLGITSDMTLKQVNARMQNCQMGGTDLSTPIKYAMQHNLNIDAFVQYTDNETWMGQHVCNELKKYRKNMNKPNAGTVVVASTSTRFTIADPKDPRMLDVVGFAADTPQAISNFITTLD